MTPLALRLPLIVRRSTLVLAWWILRVVESRAPDDVVEAGEASPHGFKSWRAIALAIQIPSQLGDTDQGFTQGEFFFKASRSSTRHSTGSNRLSQDIPGTSRPSRVRSMIRQAITASIAMVFNKTAALWF